MTATVEDVISFARLILYGSSQEWGKSWTQREIDGFFYNRFLNPPLQAAIRKARRRSLGHENPPYPCDWRSPEAPELMVEPWGNDGSLDDLGEYFLGGSGPQVAHWKLGMAVRELHEPFCLVENYLHCAMVHGTPVPFKRLYAFPEHGPARTLFTVVVYSLPLGPPEREEIRLRYEYFWAWVVGHRNRSRLPSHEASAITISLNDDGPLRLEIRSDASYVSSSLFPKIIGEATKKFKSELGGSSSIESTVRTWGVYLLALECVPTNRTAIKMWNDAFGDELQMRYNFEEDPSERQFDRQILRGSSVTTTGESHFSSDKANLESRIKHYQAAVLDRSLSPTNINSSAR